MKKALDPEKSLELGKGLNLGKTLDLGKTFDLGKILDLLLNWFFPNQCVYCGEIIPETERACPDCTGKLSFYQDGKYSVLQEQDCLDGYGCALYYLEPVPRAVSRFKFHDRPQLAGYFAGLMAERLSGTIRELSPDLVCCVPMHEKKQRKRGYNQADLLAKELAAQFGLAYHPGLLVKRTDNRVQHSLNAKQRKENVKGAYQTAHSGQDAGPDQIMGKAILLVDDVITTGSTINECARTLKREGARLVYGAAFARTVRLPKNELERILDSAYEKQKKGSRLHF